MPDKPAPLPTLHYRGKWYTFAEALALAIKQNNRRNFAAALEIYDCLLAKDPDHAVACLNRGVTLSNLGRFDEALKCYDRALALKPDFGEVHQFRTSALQALHRFEEAVHSDDLTIARGFSNPSTYNNRGNALQKLQRWDDALAAYDQALALQPNFAEALCNRGHALVSKGRMQEAEQALEGALAQNQNLAPAMFHLANIRTYRAIDHPDIARIKAVLAKDDPSIRDKDYLYFALGKILDQCGHYDEAFASFQKGNELCRAACPYDPAKAEEMTKRTIEVFSNAFLDQKTGYGSNDPSPIFVLGLPRSGTTLAASVLSNHPSIASAGELSEIGLATLRLSKSKDGSSYPEAVRLLDDSLAGEIIAGYLQRLRRDVGKAIPFVIDKNPLNFKYLGLIALLFPRARIIHCTRDPMDTGLSLYFQRFTFSHDYSFDLRAIGHFYRQYLALMEHWRQALPLKMIEMNYEDMVTNPEKTTLKALELLDLEWDPRCLSPHTNPRAVETASAWQVRQPIYQGSVSRWQHYEKHLEPLREAMETSSQVTN